MPLLSRTALRRCFLFSLKAVVRLRDDFFTVNLTSSSELGKISKEQRAGEFDVWATSLVNPNFADYVNNCGAKGIRVSEKKDLATAMRSILEHDGPALLEVIADVTLI